MAQTAPHDVTIIGGGIGGLTLALFLHQNNISCRVYEAVPHDQGDRGGHQPAAARGEGARFSLGLLDGLDRVGIRTKDASYFNQHGQHIYTEAAGIDAGYNCAAVLDSPGRPARGPARGRDRASRQGLGRHRIPLHRRRTGRRLRHREFRGWRGQRAVLRHVQDRRGRDGIKSVLRHQFYPDEGEPRYSGYTIWRGVLPYKPFLSGANTIRAGWMPVGKIMVYPIRNNIDDQGNQLMNWVVTQERPRPKVLDWNKPAKVEDFFEPFRNWHFDWLDIPDMLLKTERPLIFPMVDRDPLPTWTFGRATLLGDAAHPMYPRGSNGAGQSIIDARVMTQRFCEMGVTPEALAGL
jgi:2-polyprenyl-6-methoxyphenol hydroxylase-like FAD-dependent oxidoreductase